MLYGLPFGLASRGDSPVASANTIPLAVAAGAGASMSREIHDGVNTRWPFRSSTLNATILPLEAAPFVTGNCAAASGGPDKDAYTQRVLVSVSSQLEKAPRNPLPAYLVSALAMGTVR